MVTGLLTVMTKATQRALERANVVTRTQLDMGLRDLRYRIERKIEMTAAAAENELFQALATRIGMMLAEAQSLRDTIAQKDAALAAAQQALADSEAGVQQQIADALELDAQRDAARLEELLRQAGGAVPAPVPPVEVPPAGEPAQPPADAPVEVPPVDEGSLPVTTDPATPVVEPVPSDPATTPEEVAGPGDMTDPGAAGEGGEGGEAAAPAEGQPTA